MKQLFLILVLCASQLLLAQTDGRQDFAFKDAPLAHALAQIEHKFDIRYSYADSIVESRTLTLAAQKYSLAELHQKIAEEGQLTITKITARYYSIANAAHTEPLREVAVNGFMAGGIDKTSRKVTIRPKSMELLPGVTDADILLSLQQLPGVKSPNETATGLHVRGGTPDQNLVVFDGIRMYHPGHLFGMISGFNPQLDQTVHFYDKAANPRFGERVSSVIDIRLSEKIPDSLTAEAGLNALNADICLKIPLVKKKLGLQLAARKSFTEWLQTPTFKTLERKVFQNTDFGNFDNENRFRFEDYTAKLTFRPGASTLVAVTGIFIDNYLDFTFNASGLQRNQKMDIGNGGYSLNWKQQYSPRLSQKTVLYYSAYSLDYQNRLFEAAAESRFIKRNRIVDSGLELGFDYKISDRLGVEYGYQLQGNAISHSFKTKAQGFEVGLDQSRLFNTTHAGYFNAHFVANQWNLETGARYNYFRQADTDSFEPRISLQWTHRKLALQASYEKKSQIATQIRESVANDLSLENYVWILADNANYPLQRAQQYTTGFVYKTGGWLLDTDLYYKDISGLTSMAFGLLNQYDSFNHRGKGFTKGAELLLQKTAAGWRSWITYTYQDSEHRYEGLNNNRYFAINSESRHAISASVNKSWNRFSVAAGWFWHSGKPYSVPLESGRIVSFNTHRLESYHRLDISAMYGFGSKSWSGKIGCSVYNAYANRSVISREYDRKLVNANDLFNATYTIRDYRSLGFTPNLFVRVRF